jgi:sensor histidine kinase regulating citrate/malate metabolism
VAFDSIINYKLRNAVEKEIELQVDVSVPQKLNIEISDVVTIVGNLLDNAINAVMKVKNKEICLKISFSKGNLFINIKNTFNGDVRCIDGEIVSTNGDNHGYGLKNIRAAVEKHNGYVNIHYIDNMFSVEVFLYAHSN